jgi:hypothetical protein
MEEPMTIRAHKIVWHRRELAGTLVALNVCLASACGDPLATDQYQGDPLVTIQGALALEPTSRPNQTLQITLVWSVEDQTDYKVNQDIDLNDETFGVYRLDLFVPPPDGNLNTDPQTGGEIGFAHIFAYDDLNGEGPVSLADIEPADYPSLLYRMRGGSSNYMLGYAKDAFSADSNIGSAFNAAITPGFFLVRFDGDCLCPFSSEPCHNSDGESCVINPGTILPTTTDVDLTIVDDISSFEAVHSPDWLFFE